MNRLTVEERRRIYLAQQRTRETMPARRDTETVGAFAPSSDRGRLRWIAAAAMIAALLGGGLFASPTLEFRALDSLVEALLPKL
jgi:hypothetical protein